MKLHESISKFLNGEHYSLLSCRDRSAKWLIREVTRSSDGIDASAQILKAYSDAYSEYLVTKTVAVSPPPPVSLNRFDDASCRAVVEFVDFVRMNFSSHELVGAYLHGSLGSYEFLPGYSDFDALLIIRKEALGSLASISEIRRKISRANAFLYLFDPLQHHNLFIISEYDMQFYLEPTFPLVLFSYAKEVTEFGCALEFRCLAPQESYVDVLSPWGAVFANWAKKDRLSTFEIKHAIQSTVFLPVL